MTIESKTDKEKMKVIQQEQKKACERMREVSLFMPKQLKAVPVLRVNLTILQPDKTLTALPPPNQQSSTTNMFHLLSMEKSVSERRDISLQT